MTVQVLFFGATAEITGERRVEFELPARANASDVVDKLIINYPLLAKHRLHLSINQQHAISNVTIKDGDELAIFTAVSGG